MVKPGVSRYRRSRPAVNFVSSDSIFVLAMELDWGFSPRMVRAYADCGSSGGLNGKGPASEPFVLRATGLRLRVLALHRARTDELLVHDERVREAVWSVCVA